ncbi:hypothetical protein RUM4293_00652 [Ruegeria atlantica]|uniref:Hemolysin n=1 Tax=Ruegeria atlantica TaxID=81569 RepID=A0A0P1E1G4_9RHOB|nr:hypothetical protein RUM4293_00652 [Ruegeria atlantica]
MKVMLRCLAVVGAGLMAACLPADEKAEAASVNNGRQACEAKGGVYEVAGKAQQYVCVLPLARPVKKVRTVKAFACPRPNNAARSRRSSGAFLIWMRRDASW